MLNQCFLFCSTTMVKSYMFVQKFIDIQVKIFLYLEFNHHLELPMFVKLKFHVSDIVMRSWKHVTLSLLIMLFYHIFSPLPLSLFFFISFISFFLLLILLLHFFGSKELVSNYDNWCSYKKLTMNSDCTKNLFFKSL